MPEVMDVAKLKSREHSEIFRVGRNKKFMEKAIKSFIIDLSKNEFTKNLKIMLMDKDNDS